MRARLDRRPGPPESPLAFGDRQENPVQDDGSRTPPQRLDALHRDHRHALQQRHVADSDPGL